MEYSVNKLSKLAGVSARTLRYYDEIGLLTPVRISTNGYRIYGAAEVDKLQQILFFRELEFPLEEIARLISEPSFNKEEAFTGHLAGLKEKKKRLEALILNLEKTIASMKGETNMTDKEKFEGFTQKLIDENERKYGKEIREKYGDKAVDESNAHLKSMPKEKLDEAQSINEEFEKTLAAAFMSGDNKGELAMKACDLHRQWLCVFYPKYNKEYHKGLGDMYVADERFKANYEKLAPGCTEFFRDAIYNYCDK